jgi:hypothetical protein
MSPTLHSFANPDGEINYMYRKPRLDPDSIGPVDLDPRRQKRKIHIKRKKGEEMLDVLYVGGLEASSVP